MGRDEKQAPRPVGHTLDEKGRCCGRKPIFYKTRSGLQTQHDPHHFCTRCCAEFDGETGVQRTNWQWHAMGNGLLYHIPTLQTPVSYTHLTLPTTPYV